jgi:Flp pilus assembly protein TadB
MNSGATKIIVITGIFVLFLGVLLFRFIKSSRRSQDRNLSLRDIGRYIEDDEDLDADSLESDDSDDPKEAKNRGKKKKKAEPTVEELLIMAGRLSPVEREHFHKRRRLAPVVFGFGGVVVGSIMGDKNAAFLLAAIGLLLGLYVPMYVLRGWVKTQHEELSYYLPLLIEQISIGVSSSLDIGPCLSQLVEMADERKSHNAATQLLKYALSYVKSGVSLEQALAEIGKASGQAEFKHALLALSQVAKFGGEVSKQLQELADSVSSQRETKIETAIKRMEVKAAGPVSMVFLAYIILLGLGIAAQVMTEIN